MPAARWEHAGATLGPEEVRELLQRPRVTQQPRLLAVMAAPILLQSQHRMEQMAPAPMRALRLTQPITATARQDNIVLATDPET